MDTDIAMITGSVASVSIADNNDQVVECCLDIDSVGTDIAPVTGSIAKVSIADNNANNPRILAFCDDIVRYMGTIELSNNIEFLLSGVPSDNYTIDERKNMCSNALIAITAILRARGYTMWWCTMWNGQPKNAYLMYTND